MKMVQIEICCGSADDAIQAHKAGIKRIELNTSLFLGGLTPTIGAVKIAKATGLEIMAMVRPREGGFCYTDAEFETMLLDTQELLKAGADGIVFGILQPNGTVDELRCKKMLEVIGEAQSVFHRAIDVVPDWKKAMDSICALGFTRILTSGQAPSVQYGAAVVKEMIEYAAGRIEILPGAGIKPENAIDIIKKIGCNQIHLSMRKICYDTSAENNPQIYFGGALYPPEDRYYMADAEKIENLVGKIGE